MQMVRSGAESLRSPDGVYYPEAAHVGQKQSDAREKTTSAQHHLSCSETDELLHLIETSLS